MIISFNPAKRATALKERGIDFADAWMVWDGYVLTKQDTRRDYGEGRFQTLGMFNARVAMVVWTPRGDVHHVISMRYCHEREARSYHDALG